MDRSTSLAWRVPMALLLWISASINYVLADCGPKPIAIPITDVVLANRTRRGVLGAVGSPPQNISFTIDTFLNNTWIYNVTDPLCPEGTTTAQCATIRGGFYNPENSASHQTYSNISLQGDDADDMASVLGGDAGTPVQSSWTTDDLNFSEVTLHNFSIGMPGFEFGGPSDRQANLGLGQSSTLLQRLKDEGHIASRSFSYWWGLDNSLSRNAMDGQIVFGGYDAAKVTGEPFTQPLVDASWLTCGSGMTVPLTDMLLNFPNGSQADLHRRTVLTGCIQPAYPILTYLPGEYWEDFESTTGTSSVKGGSSTSSTGVYWNTPVYSPDNVYPGSLDFQVQGGPTITIPNDALIVPDQRIDSSGIIERNVSAPVLLFNPSDNLAPNLGLASAFFTGAYLSVNLDERTWTIWRANATTDSRLVAIGDKDCRDSTDEGVTAGSESLQKSSLSAGAIAGIAVGAVCVCLLIVAAVIFFRRKSKAKINGDIKISAPLGGPGGLNGRMPSAVAGNQWVPEMTGNTALATELYARRDPSELPYDHAKEDFQELPHDHDMPAELAYHTSRYRKHYRPHADAFELSSTPRR